MLYENTPTLATDRLVLRRFTENDVEDVLLLYGNEEVNRFLPWFPVKTLEEAARYISDNIFPCYQKASAYSYAITLKTDSRVIGYLHLHDIGGSNDMGYGLRKEFWHKGIVTEAGTAVVDRLRGAGFPFITATHDINNPYSGKVMKKLGMTYRYSYEERWQPKDIPVIFRMYQLDLGGSKEETYWDYWNKHSNHFVEDDV